MKRFLALTALLLCAADGVADARCTKLRQGAARAVENHVNAQRGKRLRAAEADLLIRSRARPPGAPR